MILAPVDYLILALYFALVLGIGWKLRRKISTSGDFLTAGHSVPVQTTIEPRMITRENLNSAEVQRMLSQDWTLGHSPWSAAQ